VEFLGDSDRSAVSRWRYARDDANYPVGSYRFTVERYEARAPFDDARGQRSAWSYQHAKAGCILVEWYIIRRTVAGMPSGSCGVLQISRRDLRNADISRAVTLIAPETSARSDVATSIQNADVVEGVVCVGFRVRSFRSVTLLQRRARVVSS